MFHGNDTGWHVLEEEKKGKKSKNKKREKEWKIKTKNINRPFLLPSIIQVLRMIQTHKKNKSIAADDIF